MQKPTTRDVARQAGVSLATVDRVLNGRPGVRQAAIDKVNEAIREIGFVRDISAANLARKKAYRLVFVLPDRKDQFLGLIGGMIEKAAPTLVHERTVVRTLYVPANDPHAIVQKLGELRPEEVDGVAIMAPETPQVRDAIHHLKSLGMAVVAFVSDQPNADCDHFVGVNDFAAGQTAAKLIGRFLGQKSGTVVVVTETMQSSDSLARRLGFDSIMQAHFPSLSASPSLETYNDPERVERILASVMESRRDVVAFYLMNSDSSDVLSAIERLGAGRRAVIVAHELTPRTRRSLAEGTIDAVITQDVGHLVRSALRVLRAKIDNVDPVSAQERIRIEIILKENMPEAVAEAAR